MARKQGKVITPIVHQGDLDFIDNLQFWSGQFEVGSAELRTWNHYIEVCKDEAQAEARLDLIYEPFADKQLLEPKERSALNQALNDLAVQQRRAFGALISHEMVIKHTFTVPDKDAHTLIVDALKANQDAMPDEYMQLTGLERHREFERLATDLIAELKSQRVAVRENDELEAPYCDDCEAEIAA